MEGAVLVVVRAVGAVAVAVATTTAASAATTTTSTTATTLLLMTIASVVASKAGVPAVGLVTPAILRFMSMEASFTLFNGLKEGY
ncbi:hypothetical protein PF006_g25042 [Phytophthora fragariae]|uniref:Uncharacterized protein n=1 Tax=Phytophthora fragariae TaxID=53985 RepID=A0A6A3R6M6_9STRA|nr:hypothetical protein PF006_g25042 [Phytophthora fragariae]